MEILRKLTYYQNILTGGGTGGNTGGGNTGGGTDDGWIGDGNTHIWISLQEGRTSPMLGCCPNGTVTVDWGDGTTPDVLTGTSTSTVKWTPNHEYAKAGDYVITLTVDGEVALSGTSGGFNGSFILRYASSSDNRNRPYCNSVRMVEVGDCVANIGNYAFGNCHSLTSVTITDGITWIGQNAFEKCYGLSSVVIPDSITFINDYAFSGCYGLSSVVIPGSVVSINSYAFYDCYNMRCYDFTKHTVVPTLSNTNAFRSIPADCEIRVPAALYDEWIAATNWATYASQIVAV